MWNVKKIFYKIDFEVKTRQEGHFRMINHNYGR